MKIMSWNVNGLRAIHRKGNWNDILKLSPDIFCLQEIKATVDQLPDEIKSPLGYYSYFDSPKEKKGYSGVAIFSKKKPDSVTYQMGVDVLDKEGRLIAATFGDLVVITVYFPNGGGGPERLEYKMEFYKEFLKYVEKLRKSGKKVIFCGDVNTAHKEIDLARPKENKDHTGFLPIERAWLDEVVEKGYVDVFRHFYPDTVTYTWWDMKTAARERNIGWRIDYFFASPDIMKDIKSIEILNTFYGSDHCPIVLELK